MKFTGHSRLEVARSEQPLKEDIVKEASRLIGSRCIKYMGPESGQSPERFDCSGFVKYVLKKTGFIIPDFIGVDGVRRPVRHTNEFWDTYGVTVQSEPEGGDLVFFSRNGLFPTHIGIMESADRFIHSPGKNETKVTVEDLTVRAIKRRHESQRQLYISNPIGFKAPTLPLKSPTLRYHQRPA